MEVHHHPHMENPPAGGAGKKFTHYLWEFLMLFLAVFCGFLAENQREHMVEQRREKQYMMTMLEDLKADTALLDKAFTYWNARNARVDSVAGSINFPIAHTDFTRIYRNINSALDYYSFKYNDRTISQLKNAGGFRLITNDKVANKIIAYDQFNNDAIVNIAYQYNKFYENVILLKNKTLVQEIINKIDEKTTNHLLPYSESNNEWIGSMIRKYRSPFSIPDQTAFLFEFKNALLSFRKDFSNMNWGYSHLLEKQAELIKLISKEYHLK